MAYMISAPKIKTGLFSLLGLGIFSAWGMLSICHAAHGYSMPLPDDKEYLSCPKGTKGIQVTTKGLPQLICAPKHGPTQRIVIENPNKTLNVSEAGAAHGPLAQAYSKYYNSLSADDREGLVSPDDPHLVLQYYYDRDQVHGEILHLSVGVGKVSIGNFLKLANIYFDLKGNELSRENRFERLGTQCSQFTFSVGLVSEHCDVSDEEQQDSKNHRWYKPHIYLDSCTDLKTKISVMREVTSFKGEDISAMAFANGKPVAASKFKDQNEADKIMKINFNDFDASAKAPKSKNIWEVLYRCARIKKDEVIIKDGVKNEGYEGRPGIGESVQRTMLRDISPPVEEKKPQEDKPKAHSEAKEAKDKSDPPGKPSAAPPNKKDNVKKDNVKKDEIDENDEESDDESDQ